MPFRDVPGIVMNPGILGQGYGCVQLYTIPGFTWDSHGLLGNPGILGQGYGCVLQYAIQGCTWDSHGLLYSRNINRKSWDTWREVCL